MIRERCRYGAQVLHGVAGRLRQAVEAQAQVLPPVVLVLAAVLVGLHHLEGALHLGGLREEAGGGIGIGFGGLAFRAPQIPGQSEVQGGRSQRRVLREDR